MDLHNAVVLITGASSGIGEALAHELVRAGARVVLFARRENHLRRVATDVGLDSAITVVGDVSFRPDILRAVDVALARFGKLDILINNAGMGAVGRIETLSEDLLDQVWRTNVLGVILAAQAAIPVFRSFGGGLIVNVSSVTGIINPPTLSMYNASKAAVTSLSQTMRKELAEDHIRVLNVHPGFVANTFFDNSLYAEDDTRDWKGSAVRAGRTSQDAARDIVRAIRDDQDEFRHEDRASRAG